MDRRTALGVVTYPLAENEKHAIRHKWLMRAKDEAWEK